MHVRTRFAPSPTGFLHVGGVRTALFSWLYAKKHGGDFILRIEDTDTERSNQESVEAIVQGLEWLGLYSDEGPVYQSERYARYQSVVEDLLLQDKAYRCICSKERLETLRAEQMQHKQKPRYDGHCRHLKIAKTEKDYVIRFKNPLEGSVSFEDEVYGSITVDNAELDDLVLFRSDGHPTYNFAVVVDDWDMRISHVIRGDDHINNTPRQINLYHALGAPVPKFAHLPMILGDDGKRLSKRHGAVSVLQFKEMGYLPEALLNYLVRLGWSDGDREIFSLQEMISAFDLNHVSRGTSSFNYEKLDWLNQHYLKTADVKRLVNLLKPFFDKAGLNLASGPDLEQVIPLMVDRAKTLQDLVEKSHYFYSDEISYDPKACSQYLHQGSFLLFDRALACFADVQVFDKDTLAAAIKTLCSELQLKMPQLAQPLRIALTGNISSPSLDITMALIGKDRVLDRITRAKTWLKTQSLGD